MNRKILKLAVPSIVSNVTIPLLSIVDIAIMGNIGNASYLAVISVGTMIFNVMYWVLGFLRMGTSGMTSQALGRKDTNSIRDYFSASIKLAVTMGFCFILLHIPLRNIMMWAFQVEEVQIQFVSIYFNICIIGAPAVLGSFALNGWLIGMQNTRIPMFTAIVQNIINIILSLLFVFVLHMDIAGVALGTMLAQWTSFAMLLWLTRRSYAQYIPSLRFIIRRTNITLWRGTEGRTYGNIFLRTLCLVAVNLYFTSAGSAQGILILAVNTLLMTFFTIFSYVMDGFAFAAEAMGGKFYGADDSKALSMLHKRLLAWGITLAVAFSTAYYLGGSHFLRLLTSDAHVITTAKEYFHFVLLIPVCGVLAFIYDGLFIGMTKTREMLFSCLTGAAVFFILYFLLRNLLGNNALWWALLAYLALRSIFLAYCFVQPKKTSNFAK